MRVLIDEAGLEEEAANWWRKISPALRAVYIQSLWECGHDEDNQHEDDIQESNNLGS